MIVLDAKQAVLTIFFLGVAIFFLVRYLVMSLRARRFNHIADIISSSSFDDLNNNQKNIFIEHIREQGDQLKYDSGIYKIQRFVYGSISLFFSVSAFITLIQVLSSALAYFNVIQSLGNAIQFDFNASFIQQTPLVFIWCFGAAVFYILYLNATKNLDFARGHY